MEKFFDVVYMVVKFEFLFIVYFSLCFFEKKIWGVVREYLFK